MSKLIGPHTKSGRKTDPLRAKWMKKLALKHKKSAHPLPVTLLVQLELCSDDAARRLIAGTSRKRVEGEGAV